MKFWKNKRSKVKSKLKQKLKVDSFKELRWVESLILLIVCGILSLYVKDVNAGEINPDINDLLSADVGTRTCLVFNLYHESRSESDMANIMILNTVFNRVKSPHFPDTPCEVVKQDKQYSWLQDGKTDKMRNLKQVKRLTKLVDKYLMNKELFLSLSEDVDHYHSNKVRPLWSKSERMKKVAVIDQHIFYIRN
ncbi:endolysin [Vibrio phage PWH3a-P1]|uniref:endolysin n=1 Tax=Vibrio phage PWH3a-P1 TaxID=754058 RepID=UPI0002C06166|nr:endolysin [Vibrio phage PWH3a-P1]AGH31971.1 hypothetical protein VPIG_00114 [Vibrio phage PWH3a-P1]